MTLEQYALSSARCHTPANRALIALVLLAVAALVPGAAQQPGNAPQEPNPAAPLPHVPPDAPKPKVHVREKSKVGPCQVIYPEHQAGSAMSAAAAQQALANAGLELLPHGRESSELSNVADLPPCPPQPIIDWFARFINGPEVRALTPREKARLAMRNLLDPFNAVTILGQSAISVAVDSHSAYGPGFPGFARNVGVSYTEDMTGEFLGTFLLPSIFHEDPHYHRMPQASIPRRITHAITQVFWTQSDTGHGMLNVSNLIGGAAADEIGNLYVPGRETDLPSSTARYVIGLSTDPIDNFITEFVPDVARRIHIRIVLVQRIIDRVSDSNGGAF